MELSHLNDAWATFVSILRSAPFSVDRWAVRKVNETWCPRGEAGIMRQFSLASNLVSPRVPLLGAPHEAVGEVVQADEAVRQHALGAVHRGMQEVQQGAGGLPGKGWERRLPPGAQLSTQTTGDSLGATSSPAAQKIFPAKPFYEPSSATFCQMMRL